MNRALTILFYVVVCWGLLPAAVIVPARFLDRRMGLYWDAPPTVRVCGAILAVVSGTLLCVSLIQFRRFARELPISAFPADRLVRRGLYSIWRHPIYLFYALLFAGLGLIAGSGGLLFVMLPALLLFELWYIVREERLLAQRFGDAYLEYRRQTPLVIPRFWRARVRK